MVDLGDKVISWGIPSACAAAVGWIATRLRKLRAKDRALESGMCALLHDRLVQGCLFYLCKGTCSVPERENLQIMYDQYSALGGNGTVTALMARVDKLPYKDGEDGEDE